MKKSEIKIGGRYIAKVSGKLTTVRVDAIREPGGLGVAYPNRTGTSYDVTNLTTGRKTTFRSAAKFRYPIEEGERFPGARYLGKVAANADPRDGSGVHDENPQTEPDTREFDDLADQKAEADERDAKAIANTDPANWGDCYRGYV